MSGRILKNLGRVLRGRGLAGVFSVIATGLMANALPVEQFGLVVLLHTYIMVIKGFLNFRTYEAIVRYGIPLQERGDEAGLMSLLRATFTVDVAASLLATAVAVAAVPLAAGMLQWDAPLSSWALIYSLALLTTPGNTGGGVLRLYDRFDALGTQYAVGPAVRVVLVAWGWFTGAGMGWFVLAWGVAFCAGNGYMIVRGFVELRRRARTSPWRGCGWRDVAGRDGEFWRFIGVVYWQTNIDLLPKHLSTLLAGSLLGPAAAGLFRLAREISTVLAQPAVLLREVLFPDLTRAWHNDRAAFHRLPWRAAAIATFAGLALLVLAALIGRPVLGMVGADYVPAYPLLLLLLLAGCFELTSAPLRAAVYAMGRASALLRIHVVGIAGYLGLFVVFTAWLGLIGPGLAAVGGSVLTLALTVPLLRRGG
ncbi:lipopolysaccharide biosynthesis protein [Elongatibacter sediminis]|uniref:Polysaccharide biosynthesis protein n=1 Tax=Elongatibacter sediminis TaxID=3119006 RepID=A0AAW9RHJ9_9GAMM